MSTKTKNPFRFKREVRCLMLGIDNSGKTTLLYQWKTGSVITTIPTIGFNVETVHMGRTEITIWDVGGQPKIRALWPHYCANTDCFVFVFDAADRGQFLEAAEELKRIAANDDLRNTPVLIIANKVDLPMAMSDEEIRAHLGHTPFEFRIVRCCGKTGVGCPQVLHAILGQVAPTKKVEEENETVLQARLSASLDALRAAVQTRHHLPTPEGSTPRFPSDVLHHVFGFIPLECLFPRLVKPGNVWAVCKAFAWHTFSELCVRFARDENPCMVAPDLSLRSFLMLNLPSSLWPSHIVSIALFFSCCSTQGSSLSVLLNATNVVLVPLKRHVAAVGEQGSLYLHEVIPAYFAHLLVSSQLSTLNVEDCMNDYGIGFLEWSYGKLSSSERSFDDTALDTMKCSFQMLIETACNQPCVENLVFVKSRNDRQPMPRQFTRLFEYAFHHGKHFKSIEVGFSTDGATDESVIGESIFRALCSRLSNPSSIVESYRVQIPSVLSSATVQFVRLVSFYNGPAKIFIKPPGGESGNVVKEILGVRWVATDAESGFLRLDDAVGGI